MAKEKVVRKNMHNEALEILFCNYLNEGLSEFTEEELDVFFEMNNITKRDDIDYVLSLKMKVVVDVE